MYQKAVKRYGRKVQESYQYLRRVIWTESAIMRAILSLHSACQPLDYIKSYYTIRTTNCICTYGRPYFSFFISSLINCNRLRAANINNWEETNIREQHCNFCNEERSMTYFTRAVALKKYQALSNRDQARWWEQKIKTIYMKICSNDLKSKMVLFIS